MKPKIYIETTIPSFYFETRPEPDMVSRRAWTRAWWRKSSPHCVLFSSLAVIDEITKGDFPSKAQCLDFLTTPLELIGD